MNDTAFSSNPAPTPAPDPATDTAPDPATNTVADQVTDNATSAPADPLPVSSYTPASALVLPKRGKARQILFEYLMLTVGTLFTTIGLYVFAMPNRFVMGGVTGISIVLAGLLPAGFPLSAAAMVTVMNILLLLIGFAVLGRDFGFKTVYTSLLLSGVGMFIEWLGKQDGAWAGKSGTLFPLTGSDGNPGNLVLELALSVILPGIGAAIAFYYNGSGGGTDIIAMILKKKFQVESGKALICVDFFIMLVSFSYGLEIGLLSATGLFTKSLIVDKVNLSLNRSKYCMIITTHPKEVGEYVNVHLHRGATMWKGRGVYTGERKYILMVVMNARQAKSVRKAILAFDEHAFIIVDETSDIVGNGFRALL